MFNCHLRQWQKRRDIGVLRILKRTTIAQSNGFMRIPMIAMNGNAKLQFMHRNKI